MKRIILLVVFLSILLVSIPAQPAFAIDRSIVSGAICQPHNHEDFSHLRYFVRGVKADGKDVTVDCPIIRDSIGFNGNKKLTVVEAFYTNSVSPPPLTGTVWSCDKSADCLSKQGSSIPNGPPSVRIFPGNLPVNKFRYFVYQTKIPEDALLLSIYTEEQD